MLLLYHNNFHLKELKGGKNKMKQTFKEQVREHKRIARNYLLRENALENLARIYEYNNRTWRAIATHQRLALDGYSYPETRARAYYNLARLYNQKGCKLRAKLCSWIENKYYRK